MTDRPPADMRPLPRRTSAVVRIASAAASFAAVAAYALLNLWMGFNTVLLLFVGVAAVAASSALTTRLSVRWSAPSAGSVRSGVASNRLRLAAAPVYALCLTLLTLVVWTGRAANSIGVGDSGWQPSTVSDGLVMAGCVALFVGTRIPRVRYVHAAREKMRRRQPPGRADTTAVIVVHGIGAKRSGGPLGSVADPIEQLLYKQAPERVLVRRYAAAGSLEPHVEFLFQKKLKRGSAPQRVDMSEVLWAATDRRSGGLQTIGWITRSLPLLLVMILAPDRRDLRQPSLSRITYRLVLPLIIILSVLQPGIWPWTLAVLVLLVATTVFRRTNLLGDVEIASRREEEVAAITARINRAVDAALETAATVVVIGHSQGGYLSYRALRERGPGGRAGDVDLIGVGSGLKPISALRSLSDRRSIALTWLTLIAGTAVFLSLAPVVLALLQYEKPFLVTWMSSAAQSLVDIGPKQPFTSVPFSWRLLLPWSGRNPAIIIPDHWQIGLFAFGVVGLLVVWRRARSIAAFLGSGQLGRPFRVRRWTEITSSVDSVGRLAFPRLTDAELWENPTSGNALLDHISYFRLSSPTAWYLGSFLFEPIVSASVPALREWAQYLSVRAWRARAFATTLCFLLIGVYAINRINVGAGGMGALVVQLGHPGAVLVGLLLIALIGPALSAFDRWRLTIVLGVPPLEPPPALTRPASRVLRLVNFLGWVCVAAFAGACFHHLVRYTPMTTTEVRILPIAPLVISALLFSVAGAVAIGYRPPTVAWVCIVAFVGYWTTYLPGEGQIFVVLGVLIVGMAIVSAVTGRLAARPLALPDSVWPGYQSAETDLSPADGAA